MVDTPERIYADRKSGQWFAHQSGCNYVRSDLADTRIAELEAENERLRTLVMAQSRASHSPEALSRTGAVKVDECKHVDWGQYPDGMRVCSYCGLASHPDDAAVERFAAAMKAKLAKKRSEGRGGWQNKEQCSGEYLSRLLREHVEKGDPIDVGNLAMMLHQRSERLSALEPAAPEGQQEAAAYRIHAPEDDYYGTGPDRLQFHPLAQYDLDNGYRQTPLYTRPSEQAVTEAMVEAAVQAVRQYTRETLLIDEHRELVRTALKAAMEAGG